MAIIKPFSEIKCRNCDSNGFIIGNHLAVKCDCRLKYEHELLTSNILINSGLLNEGSSYDDFKRLIEFDFSDYHGIDEEGNIKKIRKYFDEFDSDIKPFKHLHCYVYGEQGTQKSYTMRGLLSKLACNGKKVYYAFTKDLISLMIDAERNEESRKKLNYIQNVDVLVLDEFDENRICLWQSGYKEKSLIVWLKYRLEVIRNSTWFISNFTIEHIKESQLGELYGDLIDRETKYGRFHFKDKFGDNVTEKEVDDMMKFIWGND